MSLENETEENSYLSYLKKLTEHHTIPVLISEFGVPSSRGQSSYEQNRNLARDQGMLTETEQGEALISLYQDIKEAGAAGGIVFSWQDEWFKRSWNTAPFVDSNFSAYWSDAQTSEQAFGLLAFDPGLEESMVYLDGDRSDWQATDPVIRQQNYQLSMQYDEKYLYFLVENETLDLEQKPFYLALDTTAKTGSQWIERYAIETTAPTDFLIEIDGVDNSRVWVQERYNGTQTIFSKQLNRLYKEYEEPPTKDSPIFEPIELILHEVDYYDEEGPISFSEMDLTNENHYSLAQTYETGKLTYGNSHPQADEFNSLADFYAGEDFVEIRIPWGLLNFSDPSQMKIHDDYYEHYGVEHLKINQIQVGVGDGEERIEMAEFELEKLGRKPNYHERLKESYHILQEHWQDE